MRDMNPSVESDDDDDDGWSPPSDTLSSDDVDAAEEPRLNSQRNTIILVLILAVMLAGFGFWTYVIVHDSMKDHKWGRSWNFAVFPWVSMLHFHI